jgi:acetyl-CoA carboxylase biotin carboxyl carrier protein
MTSITAPMAGKILTIASKAGDRVEEDETVIVMEAMKMEIPVVAPSSGVIKEIKVSPGQMVDSDAVLAVME